MPERFPSTGPMPSRQGHAPSLSTGAAAAQQGMVRIHRGAEVRYVWPVHVAGWLSGGWRVGEVEPRPQAAAAEVISQRPGHDAQLPVPAGSPSSAPEPPAAPATTVDEPVGEPIDAHLPTNLLDLEPVAPAPEPTSATTPAAQQAEVPQQEVIEPNDAETASLTAPGQAEVDAEGTAAAASEEPAPPEATEPPQEEPTPPAAPARRGRPRKVRPETQAAEPGPRAHLRG
jgi:DNA polymerase-3 subunit gamma/tau